MTTASPDTACEHLDVTPVTPVPAGFEAACADCVTDGGHWVHLRRCLTCDRVGCCDSSPGQHATQHAFATGHPVITSAEPGETWRWCYIDEAGA